MTLLSSTCPTGPIDADTRKLLISSSTPHLTRNSPENPPITAPVINPAANAAGRARKRGRPGRYSATAAAASPPASTCPSPPRLNNPDLNANDAARPANVSRAADSRRFPIAIGFFKGPLSRYPIA